MGTFLASEIYPRRAYEIPSIIRGEFFIISTILFEEIFEKNSI